MNHDEDHQPLSPSREPPAPGANARAEPSPRVLVTVCTYNERENISRLIPAILDAYPPAHILVVDDNSPDGTADVVRHWASASANVALLLRTRKEGLGAATLAGLREGLASGYEFLLNMDADFSHPPATIPALVAALNHADVAIGSRYIPGGRIEGWPLKRRLMSSTINFYSRWMLGLSAHDCSGAFRCYRSGTLRQVNLNAFRARGYAFQEEMLFRCVQAGARLAEVPIVFADRIAGQSKINRQETIRAARDLLLLTAERVRLLPSPSQAPA